MPRVSEAHLEARRQQVLDAARVCFARRGFHRTSMQDVFAESGMSAGAVYRYFKSKDEIVAAIADEVVTGALRLMDDVLAATPMPPLPEVLRRVVEYVEDRAGGQGEIRIAIQVWAEATHDERLAAIAADKYGRIRGAWREVVVRAQQEGQLPTDGDATRTSQVLFSLITGYILQRVLLGDVDPTSYADGLADLLRSSAVAPI